MLPPLHRDAILPPWFAHQIRDTKNISQKEWGEYLG